MLKTLLATVSQVVRGFMSTKLRDPVTVVLLALLIFSNVAWGSAYLSMSIRVSKSLRVSTSLLASMVSLAGDRLVRYAQEGDRGFLDAAYMYVDRALIMSQAIYELTRSEEWKALHSALEWLHSVLADMHQGMRVDKQVLIELGALLQELSKAIKNLDSRYVKSYSDEVSRIVKEVIYS